MSWIRGALQIAAFAGDGAHLSLGGGGSPVLGVFRWRSSTPLLIGHFSTGCRRIGGALITALGGAMRLYYVSAYKRQRKRHAVTCERRTRDVDSWSDSE